MEKAITIIVYTVYTLITISAHPVLLSLWSVSCIFLEKPVLILASFFASEKRQDRVTWERKKNMRIDAFSAEKSKMTAILGGEKFV